MLPAYWETRMPAADSSVLVLRSSSEASPSQYFWFDLSTGPKLFCANLAVKLFSAYDSTNSKSLPYLKNGKSKIKTCRRG